MNDYADTVFIYGVLSSEPAETASYFFIDLVIREKKKKSSLLETNGELSHTEFVCMFVCDMQKK